MWMKLLAWGLAPGEWSWEEHSFPLALLLSSMPYDSWPCPLPPAPCLVPHGWGQILVLPPYNPRVPALPAQPHWCWTPCSHDICRQSEGARAVPGSWLESSCRGTQHKYLSEVSKHRAIRGVSTAHGLSYSQHWPASLRTSSSASCASLMDSVAAPPSTAHPLHTGHAKLLLLAPTADQSSSLRR